MTIDVDHVLGVCRWTLPVVGTLEPIPEINGGYHILISGRRVREAAAEALGACGYWPAAVDHSRKVIIVRDWRPASAFIVDYEGDKPVIHCPLCDQLFLVPAEACGGIAACEFCPWEGVIGGISAVAR